MTVDELRERVKLLEEGIQQSMANHNALVGRYQEAKLLLDSLEKKESEKEE